ncbi:MAG TPA: long-chain-fatty-acid--CoA ligase [Candidatus Dormibacteraeota bacterium]|nr:long-chain-fatty-acid--CoA ligase [Candidatus Dormibacteraeota bacterium]
MRTIAEVLRWRARRRPDFPITWYQGRERSLAEMDRSSSELAAGLVGELNLEPGDRVAILDKNSDDYIELLFALDKAGAVACPVNWRLTASEVATVVDDARPKVLVVSTDLRQSADQVSCRVLDYSELPREKGGADPRRDREENVTWQLYTSGTTGVPKGAMLTNLNLLGLNGNLSMEIKGLDEYGRSLVAMPLYHIGGCGWALGAMFAGSTAVITREFVPQDILRVMIEQKINTAFLVPAALLFLTSLPESQGADFSALKNIAYGASPITSELLKRSIQTFGCRFTQVYGLTETTGAVTFLQHEEHAGERFLSCGRSGFGQELRVVDSDDREVPYGEIGEIVYRGPGTMRGYWRKEKDTAAAIRDGWFHTGDAGTMDSEGFIYIKDRIKDMIISGGENIYPAEVEAALAGHPKVADVAVIGIPDDTWGETVKAIVIRKPGSELTAEELIEWSHSRLAGFKRPHSVDFVETIPRNPSGKILKKDLRAPYWKGQERAVH